MMNEIIKMYENAGVKKINTHQSEIDNDDPRFTGISHSDSYIKYPPFTAKKQLELIKWLCTDENYISIIVDYGLWKLNYHREFYSYDNPNAIKGRSELSFEESLANLINNLWQDLTEEERKQIKEILK